MDSSAFLAVSIANALLITGLAVAHALRATRAPSGPPGGDPDTGADAPIPTAPLQRLARTSLLTAGILAGATLFIIGSEGVETFATRPPIRVLVSVLGLCAIVAAVLPLAIGRRRADAGRLVLDERDAAILRLAPATQARAVLLLVMGWTMVSAERYWAAGAVPMGMVLLLGWGVLLAWALALPAGVALGYRRR